MKTKKIAIVWRKTPDQGKVCVSNGRITALNGTSVNGPAGEGYDFFIPSEGDGAGRLVLDVEMEAVSAAVLSLSVGDSPGFAFLAEVPASDIKE